MQVTALLAAPTKAKAAQLLSVSTNDQRAGFMALSVETQL
jgi:hypothetical protein